MKFIKFLAPPLLLFIWGDIVVLQAIKLKNFYPFGQSEGDQVVPPNDDGGSGRVPISFPFPFFGQDHLSLFVSIVLFHENLMRHTCFTNININVRVKNIVRHYNTNV